MTRLLSDLSLIPHELPASATLFVRKLCDPLPHTVGLERPDEGAPAVWENALNDALKRMVRSSARPALECVPAGAQAVLFADRAELLACLATDWCDGSAITRWWWRSLFRATDVTSAVVSAWLASIEYAPPAFSKLAARGVAASFARRLPARAVSNMLDRVTRHFGLRELHNLISPSKHQTLQPATRTSKQAPVMRSGPLELLSSSEVSELRGRWAPEAFSPGLDQKARLLLVVTLMLERAPSVIRAPDFEARLLRSLLAADSPDIIRHDADRQTQRDARPVIERQPVDPIRPRRFVSASIGADGTQVVESSATRSEPRRTGYGVPQSGPVERENEAARSMSRSGSISGRARTKKKDVSAITERRLIEAPQVTPVAESAIEVSMETKMGGIFYLINAAIALGLYSDFTRPLQPGIELSIWDFLALTGRELTGGHLQSDPIWELLGTLAARGPDERPGSRFSAPEEFRMPAEWLDAFPEPGQWSYLAHRGRLILRHPAGFTVLNVKLGSRFRARNIEARLASETRCYPGAARFKHDRVARGRRGLARRNITLERWTGWIAEYLRIRLARALGIEEVELLSSMLFARAARVELGAARLDVYFSLEQLPVEVRLSGLDRNPGWVPAAGRVIAFHYD